MMLITADIIERKNRGNLQQQDGGRMAEVISEGILPGVQVNLFGYYLINLFPGESTAERNEYSASYFPVT